MRSTSLYPVVRTSPATCTRPVVTMVTTGLDQQVVEDRVGDLVADLVGVPFGDRLGREGAQLAGGHGVQGTSARRPASSSITAWATSVLLPSDSARRSPRSEEHTSELQSRGHLVCRPLLAEKQA